MQLTNKEKMLLQDQKKHEAMCIQKYKKYAGEAQDTQLKQMFNNYAAQEQQHYNTVEQILGGQAPNMAQSGQQSQTGGMSMSAMTGSAGAGGMQSSAMTSAAGGAQASAGTTRMTGMTGSSGAAASYQDALLCQDMLATEKYVSGAYDTTIFECTDTGVRQTLNHIQKEEQQHGEGLYNYLQSNGMYSTQQ